VAVGREATRQKSVALKGSGLPAPLVVNEQGQVCKAEKDGSLAPYDAGRLFYDPAGHELRAIGVLPDLARDEIVRDTAPAAFAAKLEELKTKTEAAIEQGAEGWSAEVQLAHTPPGLDLRYAGYGKDTATGDKQIGYDPTTRTLRATVPLDDREIKGLKVAAGDPALRDSLNDLMQQADAARISPWWLVAFYLVATMGEMCLAPVGLSMVSQLAPARFAVMLMGSWLLVWTFGSYIAGTFGEMWGTWTPEHYFTVFTAILAVATLVLFLLVRTIRALMHGAH
jgi:POT family proton-dependent oligopeptide transporter